MLADLPAVGILDSYLSRAPVVDKHFKRGRCFSEFLNNTEFKFASAAAVVATADVVAVVAVAAAGITAAATAAFAAAAAGGWSAKRRVVCCTVPPVHVQRCRGQPQQHCSPDTVGNGALVEFLGIGTSD